MNSASAFAVAPGLYGSELGANEAGVSIRWANNLNVIILKEPAQRCVSLLPVIRINLASTKLRGWRTLNIPCCSVVFTSKFLSMHSAELFT